MLLRLLRPQGIAGLLAALALAILLVVQKGETRHWRKQSGQFEQLYAKAQAALSSTVANYQAAAAAARAADRANAARVAAAQHAISERTANDYQARLAAARTIARRLRDQAAATPADRGAGGGAAVPGLPAGPGGIAQGAGEDRLPASDALTATEQAIQLDELIKWVKRQAAVQGDGAPGSTAPTVPR